MTSKCDINTKKEGIISLLGADEVRLSFHLNDAIVTRMQLPAAPHGVVPTPLSDAHLGNPRKAYRRALVHRLFA